jgi:hypothetical protein
MNLGIRRRFGEITPERGLVLWLYALAAFAWTALLGFFDSQQRWSDFRITGLYVGALTPAVLCVVAWLGMRGHGGKTGQEQVGAPVALGSLILLAALAALSGVGPLDEVYKLGDYDGIWEGVKQSSAGWAWVALLVGATMTPGVMRMPMRAWRALFGVVAGVLIVAFCMRQGFLTRQVTGGFEVAFNWVMPGLACWVMVASLAGYGRPREQERAGKWRKERVFSFGTEGELLQEPTRRATTLWVLEKALWLLVAGMAVGYLGLMIESILPWEWSQKLKLSYWAFTGFVAVMLAPYVVAGLGVAYCLIGWTRPVGRGAAAAVVLGTLGAAMTACFFFSNQGVKFDHEELDVVRMGLLGVGMLLALAGCVPLRYCRGVDMILAGGSMVLLWTLVPVLLIAKDFARNGGVGFLVVALILLLPSVIYGLAWMWTFQRYERDVEALEATPMRCCRECGYDLTGTAETPRAKCPECGAAVGEANGLTPG